MRRNGGNVIEIEENEKGERERREEDSNNKCGFERKVGEDKRKDIKIIKGNIDEIERKDIEVIGIEIIEG